MKPVLVLQNLPGDGPAYLAQWLRRANIPFDVRDAGSGTAFPDTLEGHAALAILGGEMSANDPLPSLRQAERLIGLALGRGVPVIGHCLGGQLMARALGGRVAAAPAPEIGWLPIDVAPGDEAAEWFGSDRRPTVFQWHYEAFDVPAGAQLLASSAVGPQAFRVGPHLAMQFHVEVDADKLQRWSQEDSAGYAAARRHHPATAQDGAAMRADAPLRLARQQALADRIYRRWLSAAIS